MYMQKVTMRAGLTGGSHLAEHRGARNGRPKGKCGLREKLGSESLDDDGRNARCEVSAVFLLPVLRDHRFKRSHDMHAESRKYLRLWGDLILGGSARSWTPPAAKHFLPAVLLSGFFVRPRGSQTSSNSGRLMSKLIL